jgi:hypothetical protein
MTLLVSQFHMDDSPTSVKFVVLFLVRFYIYISIG